MKSAQHNQHIAEFVSHNNCPECLADCQRRFARESKWPGYQHVTAYLAWIRPRLEAIRQGNATVAALRWHRDFMQAMHRRISLRNMPETGRKHQPGYEIRLQATRFKGSRFTECDLRTMAGRW